MIIIKIKDIHKIKEKKAIESNWFKYISLWSSLIILFFILLGKTIIILLIKTSVWVILIIFLLI